MPKAGVNKTGIYLLIFILIFLLSQIRCYSWFTVWVKTGSNPAYINRLRSHTRKKNFKTSGKFKLYSTNSYVLQNKFQLIWYCLTLLGLVFVTLSNLAELFLKRSSCVIENEGEWKRIGMGKERGRRAKNLLSKLLVIYSLGEA